MAKSYAAAIVLSASMVIAQAALAQSNPSADDLIRSLTPTALSVKLNQTRGLHRIDATPDAPAPAQPGQHARGEIAIPAAVSASLFIAFPSGSAVITPQAMAALNELGKALSSSTLATSHFRIEGHTDTVGSKEYNRALSERRATAVVAYIKGKFGIAESRMIPVGLGSEHLLVQTGDQTPEAGNRRVEIVNLEG